MQFNELREYEERELQIVEEIRAKAEGLPDIADFYRGITLKPPYTSHIDPWWVLLPFYRTLILGIAPLGKRDFEQKYQVSPGELIRLQSQGKIQLILRNKPTAYGGLDYLDEILELRPPSYIRSIGYAEQLSGLGFDNLVNEGKVIMGKTLPSPGLQQLQKIFGPLKDPTALAANFYAELQVLPSTKEIANQINLQYQKNQRSAVFTALLYGALLAGPLFGSLGGCHAIPMKWTQLSSNSMERKTRELDIFPIDLGRELINIIGLRLPESLDEALSIDSDKAKKALFELQEAVKKKQNEQITDRALALREAVNEVREGIESIKRQASKISKIIRTASLIVGAIGPITGYLEGQPILRTIFSTSSGATLFKFAGKLGDLMSKFGMPSYIVSIYDIKESLHKRR